MEHTVTAYLHRQSSQILEGFLWQCAQTNGWKNYAHLIPEILELLHLRGYAVPDHILQQWNEYLRSLTENVAP